MQSLRNFQHLDFHAIYKILRDIRKVHQSKELIDGYLDYYRELLMTDVTIDLVRHALEVKEEYGIQYFDALIVSAAEKLGCHEIVTEDLNPNQLYRGMAIVNPFAED